MKKIAIVLSITCLGLGIVATNSFADKIVITGTPILLTPQGNMYTLPADYTTTTGTNFYVNINGVNKVCFTGAQTTLSSLDQTVITVQQATGTQVQWTCYAYDENYFNLVQ